MFGQSEIITRESQSVEILRSAWQALAIGLFLADERLLRPNSKLYCNNN